MHLKTNYMNNCYSCTAAELLAALRKGKPLCWYNLGPFIYDGPRELHPRRDTVRRFIERGILVKSEDANATQRECGMVTYRLKTADQRRIAEEQSRYQAIRDNAPPAEAREKE